MHAGSTESPPPGGRSARAGSTSSGDRRPCPWGLGRRHLQPALHSAGLPASLWPARWEVVLRLHVQHGSGRAGRLV